MERTITFYLLNNLSLVLLILALIFASFSARKNKQLTDNREVFDIFAGYIFFFNVGIFCIWLFIINFVMATAIADFLGWGAIPFRTEDIAFNLGLGILGLMAIRESFGFRLATLIMTTCAFWGHALQYGNALMLDAHYQLGWFLPKSSFFVMVLVPILLIILMGASKKEKN